MKKILLPSSTFFWENNSEGLLYDYLSGKSIRFQIDTPEVSSLCRQWENLDNLYAARFDEESATTKLEKLVHEIVEIGLGQIHETDEPVIAFPPILCIDQGPEKATFWRDGLKSQPLLPYLSKICCFLGGKGQKIEWWRPIPPISSLEHRLDPARLFAFLSRTSKQLLSSLELILFEWDDNQMASLIPALAGYKNCIHFFFTHPDPGFYNEILDKLVVDGFSITQVCPVDVDIRKASWVSGRSYQLLVKSEEDMNHWEELLQDAGDVDYDIKPVADNNLEFFRKNVFLSEEEILSQKLTKKDIFRHQALNVNQFGTFYVFPDGTVHPAADAPAVGTLEDSVHQMIIRELEENHAWRQTRRLMEPCKNCLYHDLCPSPSVYERIFGVPGCTYWKE